MNGRIPPRGRAADDVLGAMAGFRAHDADYKGGRTWSLVYWLGEEHASLLHRAHAMYASENLLNPMAFQSVKRMEMDVVSAAAALLNGPEGTVGTVTSGGTESLFLAVLAARERAGRRPWVRRPNLVAPETIHPAVDKAAHLLGIKARKIRVDADGRVDPRALARRIDRNTVLVLASAPSYPWGVVDPIPEIAAAAAARGAPCHVDACFGGFLLPWLERLGVEQPAWDLRVPGVTSISADLHKYGFAGKGASILLHRDLSRLADQFFVTTTWQGGVYASPTLLGTRPGGPIAAAWAAFQALGEEGYLAAAKEAWAGAEELRAGLRAIPGLRLLGPGRTTIVCFASDDPAVDLFAVADQLQQRGWSVDRQQSPASLHCTVNASNRAVIPAYLDDVREAVRVVRADPSLATKGEAAVYGLLGAIPVARLGERAVRDALAAMYRPGGAAEVAPDPRVERVARFVRRVRDRLPGRGR